MQPCSIFSTVVTPSSQGFSKHDAFRALWRLRECIGYVVIWTFPHFGDLQNVTVMSPSECLHAMGVPRRPDVLKAR